MSTALTTQNGSASRAPVAAGPRGLQLGSLEEMWRFSQYVAKSGLAPKSIQSAEACFVAIEMGAEIGLPPMAALQNIAVVNGRPTIWGDAMLGVCQASGLFDFEAFSEEVTGAGDARVAKVTVRRLPSGVLCVRTFSVADAKAAKLWSKDGTWQQYPERMLKLRARSFALRDTFADILKGFKMLEEVQDYIDVTATAAKVAPAATLEDLADRLESPAPENVAGTTSDVAAPDPDDAPFADPPAELEAYRISVKELFDELDAVAAIEIKCEELVAHAKSPAESDIVQELASAALARVRGSRGQRANQKSLVE